MSDPIEHFRMETSFEGLIQLLAKALYSEPDVFVRELIQNAHDSIIRRQDLEKNLAGRIELYSGNYTGRVAKAAKLRA